MAIRVPHMTGKVVVVTDSTAYLPAQLIDELGIAVVPLYVVAGDFSGAEGEAVTPAVVAKAFEQKQTVTTSRPTPGEFSTVYRQALADGAKGVVSLHLSRELSGTWDAAQLAAEQVGPSSVIQVVDSRSTAMGLGFAVLAAAEAAHAGADVSETFTVAIRAMKCIDSFFYVDSLEHLRRGGRIGAARALLGSALSIKPILTISEGRIVPVEKARTTRRAISRLEALAISISADCEVDIAVHHLAAAQEADALATRLVAQLPNLRRLILSEVGAAVGAHVGPGMVGVIIRRRL